MKRIAFLTDMELLGKPGLSSARPRLTARAILRNPQGLYAVTYTEGFGIHMLPGGGVEEGESIGEALRREVAEETGCSIETAQPLGYVEENRAHADYTQISYYYICTTRDETLCPHLTEVEQAHGAQAMWLTLEEMWARISEPVFERAQGKFLQARDVAALTAYRERLAVTVQRVAPESPLWTQLADYAEGCGWIAGPHLAEMLRQNRFTDWEAVFAATLGGQIIGYCTFLKTDYYPENRYTPWISSIFVDESRRSQGVCGQLIEDACAYAKACGFRTVYIPSDMLGFYERYGFRKIDELTNYGGDVDNIFARDIR